MEDEIKTSDQTDDQNSTGNTKEETQADEKVDYDKELEQEIAKFETAEKNREGYQKRKAKTDEPVVDEEPDKIQEAVAAALAKELPKILPKIQGSIAEDSIENYLNLLAPGNEAKQRLIRFHFENSVGASGTIRERMENAALIADKKSILKKQSEMAAAVKNRQQLGASGLGASTEGQTVPDNILSKDQLADLKAKGWDDKKIDRFKKNLRR